MDFQKYWHPKLVGRDLNDYEVQFNALPFERTLEIFRKRKILEILNNKTASTKSLLEVGPGFNPIFPNLEYFSSIVVLEPLNSIYYQLIKSYSSDNRITILNLLIEDYIKINPGHKFDVVILSSVLHEIPNPKKILLDIHSILSSDGILLVVVPNNQSIHRLIGKFKGIVNSMSELTSTEKLMQQTSSYSPETLSKILSEAGYSSSEIITSFVKPLPHAKMQHAIDSGLIIETDLEFLYSLSEHLQDFGSEIFGLARK